MDTRTLIAGVIFGSIGMGYFVYGRKQRNPIALVSGMALCCIPYFLSNILLLVLASIAFIALPFIIKI